MIQNRCLHLSFVQVHKGKNLNTFISRRSAFSSFHEYLFTFILHPILFDASHLLPLYWAPSGRLPRLPSWPGQALASRSISTQSPTLSATSWPLGPIPCARCPRPPFTPFPVLWFIPTPSCDSLPLASVALPDFHLSLSPSLCLSSLSPHSLL